MVIDRRRMMMIGLGAGAMLALVAAIYAFATRPLQVSLAAYQRDVPIQVFGLGTVEAETISKIGFETAGTLVRLLANHGDRVAAGAVLATLQSREQEAKVAQAEAAVDQAKAGVEQARAVIEKAERAFRQKTEINVRRQQLVERGVVSQETASDTLAAADLAKADLNQAQSALGVAQANVEQTRALLRLEEARLAKYTLVAPYDGVVMTRHKELGSALNPNEPVFTLLDPASIWVLAYLDEARAGAIRIGQAAFVTRRSAPERQIEAEVVRIDIESDRVNEERRVYVRCTKCEHILQLGEQAEALITLARLPRARMVELASLQAVKGREALVWTLEDGRLRQRPVTLGRRTLDGRVEIVDGVPDDVPVVIGPVEGLRIGRAATPASTEKTAP